MYFNDDLSLYESNGWRLVKTFKNGRLFRNSVPFRTDWRVARTIYRRAQMRQNSCIFEQTCIAEDGEDKCDFENHQQKIGLWRDGGFDENVNFCKLPLGKATFFLLERQNKYFPFHKGLAVISKKVSSLRSPAPIGNPTSVTLFKVLALRVGNFLVVKIGEKKNSLMKCDLFVRSNQKMSMLVLY